MVPMENMKYMKQKIYNLYLIGPSLLLNEYFHNYTLLLFTCLVWDILKEILRSYTSLPIELTSCVIIAKCNCFFSLN